MSIWGNSIDYLTRHVRKDSSHLVQAPDPRPVRGAVAPVIVNLLRIPAAHELIEPAVVAGREAGSRFQLTIWVDNTDAVCAELPSRGVALLNGPMDRVWGQRTASFTDPDGHIWEIAQTLS